jgi:hypothetical protein
MAKAIEETPEKMQGQVGAEDAATAAVPIPKEQPPLVEPQEAAPEESLPSPAPQTRAGFNPQSYMQTVPANILFNQNKPMKTPLQQRNDMGIFWKSLAAKPDAPPIIKAIARELAGE